MDIILTITITIVLTVGTPITPPPVCFQPLREPHHTRLVLSDSLFETASNQVHNRFTDAFRQANSTFNAQYPEIFKLTHPDKTKSASGAAK